MAENYQKIKKFAEKSLARASVYPGRKLENPNLENGCIIVAEDYSGFISSFRSEEFIYGQRILQRR